jgi:hypothetical protein
MAEIERGPEPKDPREYDLNWASTKTKNRLYRTLFPHVLGGFKIPLNPNTTRPERLKLDSEELKRLERITRLAERKHMFSNLISVSEINPFGSAMQMRLGENILFINNKQEYENMNTPYDTLYKKIFNKFLIENSYNSSNDPNDDPEDDLNDDQEGLIPPIDHMTKGRDPRVYWNPETGGQGIGTNLISPEISKSDILGTILPALAGEAVAFALFKGAYGRAKAMRAKNLVKYAKEQRIIARNQRNKFIKDNPNFISPAEQESILANTYRKVLERDANSPKVKVKYPRSRRKLLNKYKNITRKHRKLIRDKSEELREVDYENQDLWKNATGRLEKIQLSKAMRYGGSVTPYLTMLGTNIAALRDSQQQRQEQGLYNQNQSTIDDALYPFLSSAVSAQIARAAFQPFHSRLGIQGLKNKGRIYGLGRTNEGPFYDKIRNNALERERKRDALGQKKEKPPKPSYNSPVKQEPLSFTELQDLRNKRESIIKTIAARATASANKTVGAAADASLTAAAAKLTGGLTKNIISLANPLDIAATKTNSIVGNKINNTLKGLAAALFAREIIMFGRERLADRNPDLGVLARMWSEPSHNPSNVLPTGYGYLDRRPREMRQAAWTTFNKYGTVNDLDLNYVIQPPEALVTNLINTINPNLGLKYLFKPRIDAVKTSARGYFQEPDNPPDRSEIKTIKTMRNRLNPSEWGVQPNP